MNHWPRATVLWSYPFRPFFLLTAIYAVVAVVGWLGVVFLSWPVSGVIMPARWHVHEMLFGMVPAAIAGFLLTAMCNWTGAKPLAGSGLLALAGLWLAGRIAMWSSAWLPAVLIVVIDSAFLFVLAWYAGLVLYRAGNRRNLVLAGVLALLGLANVLSHSWLWWPDLPWAWRGEMLAMFIIVLLMAVIGGRIIPFFTGNWLENHGGSRAQVRNWPWVNRLALASIVLLIVLMVLPVEPAWTAVAALLAGIANGIRLFGWRGWLGRSEPLIWILHLGYAWVVTGLILKGLAFWLPGIPVSLWIHAIGVGAMGTMIIGVMTRVALGHSGRPLVLPRGAVSLYWLMTAAVLLRLAVALDWISRTAGLTLSAAAWAAAFLLFLYWYIPILASPRPDGRPG